MKTLLKLIALIIVIIVGTITLVAGILYGSSHGITEGHVFLVLMLGWGISSIDDSFKQPIEDEEELPSKKLLKR